MRIIWSKNNTYLVYADKECFYAKGYLGIDGENMFIVGYSNPNLVLLDNLSTEDILGIRKALNRQFELGKQTYLKVDFAEKDFQKMFLDLLFSLCVTASKIYNERFI